MKRSLPIILGALTLALAANASAAIALFTDGRAMKVAGFRMSDTTAELTLYGGGTVTLPITRIDRIVDDEVAPASEIADADARFPHRSWRFREESLPMFDSRFDQTIVDAARKFDIDAALVSAVIQEESGYDVKSLSNKGARGLMQLMPATAERFGVTDSFDAAQNIYGGTHYLRWLLDTFDGNAELAVAAYNAGEGNVWKYNGVPPFRETVRYIARISSHFKNGISAPPSVSSASASR